MNFDGGFVDVMIWEVVWEKVCVVSGKFAFFGDCRRAINSGVPVGIRVRGSWFGIDGNVSQGRSVLVLIVV